MFASQGKKKKKKYANLIWIIEIPDLENIKSDTRNAIAQPMLLKEDTFT